MPLKKLTRKARDLRHEAFVFDGSDFCANEIDGMWRLMMSRQAPLESTGLDQISVRGRMGERGSMLLIALAVLTLLSIIAVTFVALMRLELKATENFRDKNRAHLLSNSAESAVISMLRSRPFWDMPNRMNDRNAPWIYGLVGGNGFSREGGLLSLWISCPCSRFVAREWRCVTFVAFKNSRSIQRLRSAFNKGI